MRYSAELLLISSQLISGTYSLGTGLTDPLWTSCLELELGTANMVGLSGTYYRRACKADIYCWLINK